MFTSGRLPVGGRFEEPLANLLNEQHRTVKEQLEQLKMKKSSGRQQQEAERVKPQSEKVHQTLTLDPAQRRRLQQQMQQVRLRVRSALGRPGHDAEARKHPFSEHQKQVS